MVPVFNLFFLKKFIYLAVLSLCWVMWDLWLQRVISQVIAQGTQAH